MEVAALVLRVVAAPPLRGVDHTLRGSTSSPNGRGCGADRQRYSPHHGHAQLAHGGFGLHGIG
jgi:hypothetical protein